MTNVFESKKELYPMRKRVIYCLTTELSVPYFIFLVIMSFFSVYIIFMPILFSNRFFRLKRELRDYIISISIHGDEIHVHFLDEKSDAKTMIFDATKTCCKVERSGPNIFVSEHFYLSDRQSTINQYYFGEWSFELGKEIQKLLIEETNGQVKTYN